MPWSLKFLWGWPDAHGVRRKIPGAMPGAIPGAIPGAMPGGAGRGRRPPSLAAPISAVRHHSLTPGHHSFINARESFISALGSSMNARSSAQEHPHPRFCRKSRSLRQCHLAGLQVQAEPLDRESDTTSSKEHIKSPNYWRLSVYLNEGVHIGGITANTCRTNCGFKAVSFFSTKPT